MALGDQTIASVKRRVAATVALAQAHAGKGEAQMRSSAEWTDRTGLARGGLNGTAEVARDGDRTRVAIVLSHSMGYGGWLETLGGAAMGRRASMTPAELAERQNAGNLAVVWPTADAIGPRFLRDAKRLWGGAL
jgi:hypothetical protein